MAAGLEGAASGLEAAGPEATGSGGWVVGWEAVGGLFGEIDKTEGTKILFARLAKKVSTGTFWEVFQKSQLSPKEKKVLLPCTVCLFELASASET